MIQTMFVNSFFLVNCVTFDYLRQSLTTVSVYSLELYHGICKAPENIPIASFQLLKQISMILSQFRIDVIL